MTDFLTITDIAKSFANPVLRGVHLGLEAGEIVCLLGPSGCGKTTLLRIVAGLEQADRGTVYVDGIDLASIPVHRRGFGLMFQEFALFPHQTVGENIAFGLRMAGWNQARQRARVAEMLELVALQSYAERTIFELSGGERQRVALARSLAPSPRLLMLDEPLGSLDRGLREELMSELRRILKWVGVTALYVTHDQEEAFAVADRVGVMNKGRFEQIGQPEELYAQPNTHFVARFLGLTNLLPVRVSLKSGSAETPIGRFMLESTTLITPAPESTHALLIRPEVGPESINTRGDAGVLDGILISAGFRGSDYHIKVGVKSVGVWSEWEEHKQEVELDFVLASRHWRGQAERLPPIGDAIRIAVDPSQLLLIPMEPVPAR